MKKIFLLIIITLLFIFYIFPDSNSTVIINYYYPKIDNLRFREDASTKSKIIRKFKKDEQLIFLDHGKKEVINGDKGKWIKVLTSKLEVGWVFDAYLYSKW